MQLVAVPYGRRWRTPAPSYGGGPATGGGLLAPSLQWRPNYGGGGLLGPESTAVRRRSCSEAVARGRRRPISAPERRILAWCVWGSVWRWRQTWTVILFLVLSQRSKQHKTTLATTLAPVHGDAQNAPRPAFFEAVETTAKAVVSFHITSRTLQQSNHVQSLASFKSRTT